MSENNERKLTTRDEVTDFLLYTAPDGQVKVECVLHDETIWLTQDRKAALFGVQRPDSVSWAMCHSCMPR